jgi:hypothetical protein
MTTLERLRSNQRAKKLIHCLQPYLSNSMRLSSYPFYKGCSQHPKCHQSIQGELSQVFAKLNISNHPRPCHFGLSKHLRNHFPKEGMSPIEAIKLPVLTPHISCMMKVAHHQALHAWMQSQNLRSTDLLYWGGRRCIGWRWRLGMMRALHSLTAIVLCQRDHIKATSLPE